MSRSHAFDQWYECGDKKFLNIFQAFDYQKKTNFFPEYRFDHEFIESIRNFKKPKNINHQYIKNLIVNRLKILRKKHKYLRLALGGGTDSFSVLKYCVENDIYLDEVFTHMISIDPNNIRLNIEYLPALRFAKKHLGKTIGTVNEIYPAIEDFEFVKKLDWFLDEKIIRGCQFPGRIVNLFVQCYKKTDLPFDDTLTIFCLDKPYLQNINGQIFWSQIDGTISEIMGCENTLPLFFDKENPELTVAMAFALLDHSDSSLPFIGYDTQPIEKKKAILHNMGLESTGHYFIDNHLWGKNPWDNETKKSKLALQQLIDMGRQDIVDAYYDSIKICTLKFQNLPHAIDVKSNSIKTVKRYCQKIPIYQDSFGA